MPAELNDRVTFSAGAGALDRASHLRPRAARLLAEPGASLLPLAHGRVLIDLAAAAPALGWLTAAEARLAAAREAPVFLGLHRGRPCFAADYSGLAPGALATSFRPGKFIDLRSVAGDLSAGEAAVAAAAKGVLGWHESHPRCARCGSPSAPEDGGWRRRCTACGALHFPRTDPVVIMLILSGDEALLGRQSVWPEGLYSLLAGFMEPGETIEEAVRRETREETAVEVGEVGYLACQPWPYPTTLMLGCIGRASTREIVLDPNELEDARWVGRAELGRIFAGQHPRIRPPRTDAIACSILRAWLAGEVG